MKINILKVAAFFSGMCALASCTTPELENFDEYSLTEPAKSESYYEALRAFKQSKHPISFGWYADGANRGYRLPACWRDFPTVWMWYLSGEDGIIFLKVKSVT